MTLYPTTDNKYLAQFRLKIGAIALNSANSLMPLPSVVQLPSGKAVVMFQAASDVETQNNIQAQLLDIVTGTLFGGAFSINTIDKLSIDHIGGAFSINTSDKLSIDHRLNGYDTFSVVVGTTQVCTTACLTRPANPWTGSCTGYVSITADHPMRGLAIQPQPCTVVHDYKEYYPTQNCSKVNVSANFLSLGAVSGSTISASNANSFMAVWSSRQNDGRYRGYRQVLDYTGNKISDQSFSSNDCSGAKFIQIGQTVTRNSDDNFMIVTSNCDDDGLWYISISIQTSSGQPLVESITNPDPTPQVNPAALCLRSTGCVIGWENWDKTNSTSSIVVQAVANSGTASTSSGTVLIDGNNNSINSRLRLTELASGNVAAVWQSCPTDNSGCTIKLKMNPILNNGSAAVEVTNVRGNQTSPTVAALVGDYFLVCYQHIFMNNSQVVCDIFNGEGAKAGYSYVVADKVGGSYLNPAVVTFGTSGMIVWQSLINNAWVLMGASFKVSFVPLDDMTIIGEPKSRLSILFDFQIPGSSAIGIRSQSCTAVYTPSTSPLGFLPGFLKCFEYRLLNYDEYMNLGQGIINKSWVPVMAWFNMSLALLDNMTDLWQNLTNNLWVPMDEWFNVPFDMTMNLGQGIINNSWVPMGVWFNMSSIPDMTMIVGQRLIGNSLVTMGALFNVSFSYIHESALCESLINNSRVPMGPWFNGAFVDMDDITVGLCENSINNSWVPGGLVKCILCY